MAKMMTSVLTVAFVSIFLVLLNLCGATSRPTDWSANLVQLCTIFDDSQPPTSIVHKILFAVTS